MFPFLVSFPYISEHPYLTDRSQPAPGRTRASERTPSEGSPLVPEVARATDKPSLTAGADGRRRHVVPAVSRDPAALAGGDDLEA